MLKGFKHGYHRDCFGGRLRIEERLFSLTFHFTTAAGGETIFISPEPSTGLT
jgi:hypothetical protein